VERSDKNKGTLTRPLSFVAEGLLLLFAALFLLTTFFLGCHVAILPFHYSWNAV
jgi:hypothetical protein